MTLLPSWVQSANSADAPFPLNNLPYGVFSTQQLSPRCGVAIGDQVLDLRACEAAGIVQLGHEPVFAEPSWNQLMELGAPSWHQLRARLTELLGANSSHQQKLQSKLIPLAQAQLHMPFEVREFTDFYAGKHHATNVGTMFRGPENALPPNWLHIPIGYNGRASTVIVSGTPIRRPNGQSKAPSAAVPSFGPSTRLDIECELGAIVGTSSAIGEPITVEQADAMIFGYVLLNDWSARDIQAWEYQPLGPFQAKSFATAISPWIVTSAALEPFRVSTPARERELLPYLHEPRPMLYDINIDIELQPENGASSRIASTNYREMYYSAAQQLAHHASSGCAMRSGDLIGSGTISGQEKSQRGSLLELTWGGKEPLELPDGSQRSFVEDGDTLSLIGAAHGQGYTIGFGSCSNKILPAVPFPRPA